MTLFRLGAIFAAQTLLTGCALTAAFSESASDRIEDDLIQVNEAYARANNAQILLNIVRASHRLPRYFTGASGFSSNYEHSAKASLSLTLPFGGGSNDEFSGSPGAETTVAAKPSFNVAILSAEEFSNATLSQVQVKQLSMFYENRWPIDVILLLTVDRVTFNDYSSVLPVSAQKKCPGIKEIYLYNKSKFPNQNFPLTINNAEDIETKHLKDKNGNIIAILPKDAHIQAFSCWLREVKKADVFEIEQGRFARNALEIKLSRAKILENLAIIESALRQGYTVTGTDVTSSIALTKSEFFKPSLRIVKSRSCTPQKQKRQKKDGKEICSRYTDDVRFHRRSIESIIYYLGELVRRQRHDPEDTSFLLTANGDGVGRSGGPARLIEVSENAHGNTAVSVELNGKSYSVMPANSGSRSLTVLNFLSQLVALNQSREDLQGPPITNLFAD